MALVINTNVASLNVQRSLTRSQSQMSVTLQRLSSGLRLNSARDDAAGLAISERMTAQIRGLDQSHRNINDAISMLQTSESGLQEVTNLLQRGRELSVQAANATASASDRTALQNEVSQLIAEVDRISTTSDFNSIKMFDGGSRAVTFDPTVSGLTDAQQDLVSQLQQSWLEQGEAMISTYFGITGDGAALSIDFVEGQGYLAAVSFSGFEVATGKAVELSLKIDLEDFLPSDWPNGGPSSFSNDRIVMHELTHAVMARSINMQAMPLWFTEGAAEFIHGADARLYSDLSSMDGATTADKVENLMNGYLTNDGTSQQYSAGYAATRYLHKSIIDAGGTGIKEVFDYLEANTLSTLDDAIQAMKVSYGTLAYGTEAQFTALFDSGDAGNIFVADLLTSGSLTNSDTGAIGGADADGGARDTSAAGVVPDISNPTSDPLASFSESFPTGTAAILLDTTSTLAFQVGANVGESIDVSTVAVNSGNLGIENTDLVTDAELAIRRFDVALDAVNQERARLGALQNRFESAAISTASASANSSASRSRIQDADYAQEMSQLVRSQILQQAGTALVAQANFMPEIVLSLLQ